MMGYAPCKNPRCPSYGKSHPNCQCNSYAEGGEVENQSEEPSMGESGFDPQESQPANSQPAAPEIPESAPAAPEMPAPEAPPAAPEIPETPEAPKGPAI